MLNEVYIPDQVLMLVVMGVMTSLFYVIKLTKNKKQIGNAPGHILRIANTLFIVILISSLAYQYWQWEAIVTQATMMKITLVLLSILGIFLNIMYVRANLVYKEKRGNQRIKDDPEESYKEVKKVAKEAKGKKGDIAVVIGESRENEGYPVLMKENDFFMHTIIAGSTGSGKSVGTLEPLVYQLLLQKRKGKKLGLTVVEPKRDFALQVKEYCDEMEIPYIFIDPLSEDTNTFNPMEGEANQVAEATVIVLQGLFGKQDPFFASVQELSARNVTKLLKELYDDDLDIIDVMNTLRDPQLLKSKVAELKARDGVTDLVHFFENELLGKNSEKYRQFVIGLRAQLENITSNDLLRNIMTGKSDLNINKHFKEGGVLIVNTELGALGKSGNIFGQFLIMHLQNGTFNRPGPPKDRIPHFMVVDEYSLYINPEIDRFFSVARSYRVAGIFATQSLAHLEVESGKTSGKAMRQAIMTNCRNKIVYGGVSADDAREFAEEFGKDKVVMRQATYKHKIFTPVFFPDSYRDTETEEYRFDPTDIMTELKKYTFIHKLMYDNQVQRPAIARSTPVQSNWRKLREWEDRSVSGKLKKTGTFLFHKAKQIQSRKERVQMEDEIPKTEQIGLERQGSNESLRMKDISFVGPINVDEIQHVPDTENKPYEEPILIKESEIAENLDIRKEPNEVKAAVATATKEEEVKKEKKEYTPQVTIDDGFWD